ncbi:MAG: protein-tyrosine-phosphatase [Flavobacteriales bacterium]|nr:protein-tyrosine-phosphatase [Flavobacteriales bacterium]
MEEEEMNSFIKMMTTSAAIASIPLHRRRILQKVIDFIQSKRNENKPVKLNFICTHNSRRSQLAQVWALLASHYFSIEAECYSGGVEVTAFNDRAVLALETDGVRFSVEQNGQNPIYKLNLQGQGVSFFSKDYTHKSNPTHGFAAIMTCSHADENCPFIPGAELRISLTYNDPKDFDGSEMEKAKYLERSREIAKELVYIFSKVK